MPLISQIILDGYLAPQFLSLPRKLLSFHQQSQPTTTNDNSNGNKRPKQKDPLNNHPDFVSHMRLIPELFQNEMLTMEQVMSHFIFWFAIIPHHPVFVFQG